jgi:phosphoglycerol transferase
MLRLSSRPQPTWLPEFVWVAATALVAIVVMVVDLKLWHMHARVPIFDVTGDGAYYLATVKDVVENGWFWHNPDLGAPFGQSNYDFAAPFGDVAHFAIVRVLGIVLGDPVIVFNAFFLLCFPLIAVIAHAVLRDLGASRPAALVAAILFAFLPYHLARNETHLFLTSYYAIPLAVWLVVTVAEGRRLIDRDRTARRRTLLVVGVCLLVGAASNYYAVFALLLLVSVVPIAALARRSKAIALQGAAVAALVAASFALCHSPAIIYPLVHGANEGVAKRQASDSELFGLKLTYLVIPRPEHRVGFMAQRGKAYLANTAQRGEGFDPSLGIVATVGFAAALLALLATGLGGGGGGGRGGGGGPGTVSLRRARAASAGAVALASFLIGTVGGVSALIAFEISPQVRAWNRLSLVIAFAALLTVALALTALGDRLRARGRPGWVIALVLAVVAIAGLLDQTSPSDAPNYPAIAAAWKVDGDFVSAIEQRLPGEGKILQLPYMSYPEHGQLNAISDYGMFKGYFHSDRLKWTYGAIHGRAADWLGYHQALTPGQLAAAAAAAGFGGIYLDRYGYAGSGAAETAAALEQVAGPGTSIASADQRLQFFDLQPAARRLQSRTTAAQRTRIADALLHPATLGFGGGFSYQEIDGSPFRWAGPDAYVRLDNPLAAGRELRFTAQLFGGTATPSQVTITLPDGATKTLTVTDQGAPVSLPFRMGKGGAKLRLQTDGPPAPNPADDDRDRRLRVVDPKVEDVALQQPSYVAAATP